MRLPRSIPVALVEEGARMASICNACRYCEGFCAVFPALERRLSFAEGDLAYLANLCHDCGSCHATSCGAQGKRVARKVAATPRLAAAWINQDLLK